eukprot:5952649-Karenia_brevis.AAC.1
MAAHDCEPLIWKGGLAADIRRCKDNDPSIVQSFRSILLETHLSKHHHRWLRTRLFQLCNCLFFWIRNAEEYPRE